MLQRVRRKPPSPTALTPRVPTLSPVPKADRAKARPNDGDGDLVADATETDPVLKASTARTDPTAGPIRMIRQAQPKPAPTGNRLVLYLHLPRRFRPERPGPGVPSRRVTPVRARVVATSKGPPRPRKTDRRASPRLLITPPGPRRHQRESPRSETPDRHRLVLPCVGEKRRPPQTPPGMDQGAKGVGVAGAEAEPGTGTLVIPTRSATARVVPMMPQCRRAVVVLAPAEVHPGPRRRPLEPDQAREGQGSPVVAVAAAGERRAHRSPLSPSTPPSTSTRRPCASVGDVNARVAPSGAT